MKLLVLLFLILCLPTWAVPDCTPGWTLPPMDELEKIFDGYKETIFSDCSNKERCADGLINSYTAGRYDGEFNHALRTGVGRHEFFEMAKVIEQALCIAPTYEGIVYRGIDVKLKYEEGSIVRFSSFLSTSKERQIAENFGTATLYIIRSRTGFDVSKISMFDHEKEVLFPMNIQFRITKVTKKNVVYMDEI